MLIAYTETGATAREGTRLGKGTAIVNGESVEFFNLEAQPIEPKQEIVLHLVDGTWIAHKPRSA